MFRLTLDLILETPYHHSVDLERMLKGRAKLVTVEGGEHSNLAQYSKYWSEVLEFLANRSVLESN